MTVTVFQKTFSACLYHKPEAFVIPIVTVNRKYLVPINLSILSISTLILEMESDALESRAHKDE